MAKTTARTPPATLTFERVARPDDSEIEPARGIGAWGPLADAIVATLAEGAQVVRMPKPADLKRFKNSLAAAMLKTSARAVVRVSREGTHIYLWGTPRAKK